MKIINQNDDKVLYYIKPKKKNQITSLGTNDENLISIKFGFDNIRIRNQWNKTHNSDNHK